MAAAPRLDPLHNRVDVDTIARQRFYVLYLISKKQPNKKPTQPVHNPLLAPDTGFGLRGTTPATCKPLACTTQARLHTPTATTTTIATTTTESAYYQVMNL